MKITRDHNLEKIFKAKFTFETTLSNYSFALMVSFFSLLEFLLDAFYAFEHPEKNFLKYKKETWESRFKSVFPIAKNKELKRLYDDLVRIKKYYRNPLTHGLSDEISLLVPLHHIGLVPLSYEYLSRKTHYSITGIGKDEVLEIDKSLRKFLYYIENKEPYKFYMIYLKYGFPIPIDAKKISEIKKRMTSYQDFKEYLDGKARYEDAIINRDI